MSGAALFARDLLIAIVLVAPPKFGADRLEALPLAAMVGDRAFRAEMAATHGPIALDAVEAVDLLYDPNREASARPSPTPDTGSDDSRAELLRPECQAVPFRGRVRELDRLVAWCASGTGIQVGLLLGRNGAGKTRLAARLCELRKAEGAVTGFLHGSPKLDRLPGALSAAELLVVVDEAQRYYDDIAGLLREMEGVRPPVRVRVLLVARNAGDWYTTKLLDDLAKSPAALAAVSKPNRLDLGPVDQSAEQRVEAWREALRAFQTSRPAADPAVPDLAGPEFDEILWVHLAALCAADGEADVGGPVARAYLADYFLRCERRYWRSTASLDRWGLDGDVLDVLDVAVAVATIAGATSLEDAENILGAVTDLAEQRALRRSVARWLNKLYAPTPIGASAHNEAGRWLPALSPQTLGEVLIAQVISKERPLVIALLDRATPAQTRATLTALTQAARGHPAVHDRLAEAITDRITPLWKVARTVAQRAGDPLGPILAATLTCNPDRDLAHKIEHELPEQTVTLCELAIVATQQSIERVREQPSGTEQETELGRLLSRQATRLSALIKHELALAAIDESIAIRRRSAVTGADSILADALTTKATILSELGRVPDALLAFDEAMVIHRAADSPAQTTAAPLTSRATILDELGRYEEALRSIEAAVRIYRMPDASRADLAAALDKQSTILSQLDDREDDALAVIEEAVRIRRILVRERWDAFQPDLARSLVNRARRLSDLRRHLEALSPNQEAVAIFRGLAVARRDAFLPDLAQSLLSFASCLCELERTPEARVAYDDAVPLLPTLRARPASFQDALNRAEELEMKLVMQQGIGRDLRSGEDAPSPIVVGDAIPDPALLAADPREPDVAPQREPGADQARGYALSKEMQPPPPLGAQPDPDWPPEVPPEPSEPPTPDLPPVRFDDPRA